jgi:diguanylate cyclase (GGDEF)-like protein
MRILMADDDALSLHAMTATLERIGYDVTAVKDGCAAWDHLKAPGGPPMAILDWMMPGMTGLEVCKAVRQRGGPPYIYLVLLTGKSRHEDLVEGMTSGADDYIVKPADVNELDVRLRAGRRLLDLQEALLSTQMSLKELSERDPLTALYNRRAMEELFQKERSRSDRNGRPLSLFLADVDRFKAVNDTYGHSAGDAVLIEMALRLALAVREHDSVGRWGGDELMVLLPECGSVQALKIAERFRKLIQARPFAIPGGMIRVTTSVGVTTLAASESRHLSQALEAADRSLYRSKSRGRNHVEFQAVGAAAEKAKTA